ncbi:hypothetical protein VMCG_07397 [Cytospora schulzeri]|uniref:Uncharacterized protein n=1 Tax=Cytospora schulzeri TaxID=448051 RepID=A0A423W335_9PEZI|nr:hypothetical protein VMCG_07397 [Valsa malicola]
MHSFVALSTLVLEAQDATCGYLNGVRLASYGCQTTTQKCAVYYPKSSLAADIASISDISLALMSSTTPSKTLTPRAAGINVPVITPPPQVDYPAVVCCDPSIGDCTAQATACVDAFEHPYSALCTGSCLNDPMTLKCTAGYALHCNQIQFQSPLYYQRNANYSGAIDPLESSMGVVGGPARGWFCGGSALPTRMVESTIMSRRPVFEDEVSPPTAAGIVTGSPGDLIPQPTTTPSPVTLPEQIGNVPGPNPSPQPGVNPGIVDNGVALPGDYNCDPEAVGGEDCCIDELAPGEDCCIDEPAYGEDCCTDLPIRRARQLQRRRDPEVHRVGITVTTSTVTSPDQIGLATTTVTPAAGPAMVITEGFAVVSTTYANQSGRSPFAEATRSWRVLLPTPTQDTTTTTTTNNTGPHSPKWPTGHPKAHNGPVHVSRIVGGAMGGLFALLLLGILVNWCNRRRKLGNKKKKQAPGKQEGYSGRITASRSDRARNYLWDRYAGVRDRLSWFEEQQRGKLSPPSIPPRSSGSGSNPGRSTTSPRDDIETRGGARQGQKAWPLPDGSPVGDGGGTNGSTPEHAYYDTLNRV